MYLCFLTLNPKDIKTLLSGSKSHQAWETNSLISQPECVSSSCLFYAVSFTPSKIFQFQFEMSKDILIRYSRYCYTPIQCQFSNFHRYIYASMKHDRRFNTFIQVHIMVSRRDVFCAFKPQCFWLRRVAIIRYSKKKTIQSLRKYPRLRTYSSSKSFN